MSNEATFRAGDRVLIKPFGAEDGPKYGTVTGPLHPESLRGLYQVLLDKECRGGAWYNREGYGEFDASHLVNLSSQREA
jgi:hypothetical protein